MFPSSFFGGLYVDISEMFPKLSNERKRERAEEEKIEMAEERERDYTRSMAENLLQTRK